MRFIPSFPLALLGAALAWSGPARAGPGSIYVEAPNAPAEIKLDGFKTGVTAPGLIEEVAPGTHQVEVRYGCVQGKALVRVAPDTRTDVLLPMAYKEGEGRVRVKGVPEGATFYVDEAPLEFSGDPNKGIPLPCGEHVLTIEAAGYEPVTEEIVVPVGGWLKLEPAFEPAAEPAPAAPPPVPVGTPEAAPAAQPVAEAAAPEPARGALREERRQARRERRERLRQTIQLSPRVLATTGFTALAGIGVTVGITGYMSWNPAQDTYDAIVAVNGEDDATAQAILGNEIRPYLTQMWMGFGVAAFGAVGAGVSVAILPGAQEVRLVRTWRF